MAEAQNITIKLNRIKLFAYHGVYEEERVNGNHFEIDLAVTMPIPKGAESDSLDDTIDYTALAISVSDISDSKKYHLLEALANDVCHSILSKIRSISSVTIAIRKLKPPMSVEMSSVEVVLTLNR